MARTNYSWEKRQRELAKKKKKEERRKETKEGRCQAAVKSGAAGHETDL